MIRKCYTEFYSSGRRGLPTKQLAPIMVAWVRTPETPLTVVVKFYMRLHLFDAFDVEECHVYSNMKIAETYAGPSYMLR